MDTLVIDTDAGVLSMTWRASLALVQGPDEVREVAFGPMPPSWSRARATGKTYYRSLASSRASDGCQPSSALETRRSESSVERPVQPASTAR
jgi:hypothetical protein